LEESVGESGPAPEDGRIEFSVPALRDRLAELAGVGQTRGRQDWWDSVVAQAAGELERFEVGELARMSFVANSMVMRRLEVAPGAEDLGDEARAGIRRELARVLMVLLLDARSGLRPAPDAEPEAEVLTADLVRPVGELAEDLIQGVFLLGRPQPRPVVEISPVQAVATPTELSGPPRSTASGSDVLAALLASPGDLEPGRLPEPVSFPEPPSGPRAPRPEPAQPSSVATGPAPEQPAEPPHSTPGLLAPVKPPVDDDDDEDETRPDPGDPVLDALALLASEGGDPDAEGHWTNREKGER
jgi:hypothetical protein